MNVDKILKRYINAIFKGTVFVISIFLQLWFLYMVYVRVTEFRQFVPHIMWVIKIIAVLNIIYTQDKESYKISWIVFIMVFPVVGIIMYFFYGGGNVPRRIKEDMDMLDKKEKFILIQNEKILSRIEDPATKKDVDLLFNLAQSPLYENTATEYMPTGEKYFERMLIDIKNAEKFIFLEYFNFGHGLLFSEIYDALVQKAKEGIEVVIIYDGMGCFSDIINTFEDSYKKHGIKSYAFNPYTHSIFNFISFRDHRKITVIDGNISYCGGLNVSDRYVNKEEKYGHWKDMGIRLEGEGTFGFTIMVLKMLEYLTKEEYDINLYRPTASLKFAKGFVIPYTDGPTNSQHPAESIYKKVIASAKDYIYITTPYLDIDSEFISQLRLAAQSGVDVRIIIPHIPDKVIVHKVSRSFYGDLLPYGVRIYEYTPGFIHGKVIITDDKSAIVGSINMDYRSLAWNYESAVYIGNTNSIIDIKEDFLDIINISEEVDYDRYTNVGIVRRLVNSVLKLLAPLM